MQPQQLDSTCNHPPLKKKLRKKKEKKMKDDKKKIVGKIYVKWSNRKDWNKTVEIAN
jgi:hypothetical protein